VTEFAEATELTSPDSSSSSSSPDGEGEEAVLKGWNIVSGSGETMEETEEDGVTFIRKRNKDVFGGSSSATSSGSAPPGPSSSSSSIPTTSRSSGDRSTTTYAANVGASKKNDDWTTQEQSSSPVEPEEIQQQRKVSSKPRGFAEPLPDGSTIHPKLPYWFTRLCLCLLGVLLSLFSDKYLFITFFSWEMAVLGINGLPEKEAPSSVLVLLLALMGLKDKNLQRLKTVLKLGNCVVTDLSIFVVSVLMTRVFI